LNKKGFLVILGLLLLQTAPGQEPGDRKGELVLLSYKHSYPHRIGDIRYADGDWTVQVHSPPPGDTERAAAERAGEPPSLFYWAGGRLLPPAERGNAAAWEPHDFTAYPAEPRDPGTLGPGEIEELLRLGNAEARRAEDKRHRGFHGALYGGITRRDAERQLRRIDFLGRPLAVHQDMAEPLGRVGKTLSALSGKDPELAAFLAGIGQLGCYNWRPIRGTRRMSYHSWGLAVDLEPKNSGGQIIFWGWEQSHNPRWMLVSPENRWRPPLSLIRAFENEGFIWGGKWDLYDNMHFEFRPEFHELNRLLAAEEEGATRIIRAGPEPDLHHLFPLKIRKH
jgi:hypothetical protein